MRQVLLRPFGVIAFAIFLNNHYASAAETENRLILIRSALRDAYSSVRSLDVTVEERYLPQTIFAASGQELPYRGHSWGPRRLRWVQQGRQRLLSAEPIPLNGMENTRIWVSTLGSKGYQVGFQEQHPDQTESIYRTSQPSELEFLSRQELNFSHFMGTAVWRTEQSLLTFLQPSFTILPDENIAGHLCPVLEIGPLQAPSAKDLSLTVCFDPQHDYLPRRFVWSVIPGTELSEGPSARYWPESLETVKWTQVDDPIGGGKRWLPSEVLHTTPYATRRFTVNQLSLNTTLPQSQFIPEAPFGTLVTEGPAIAGQPVTEIIVGGTKALEEYLAEQHKAALALKYPISAGRPLVDGSTPHGYFWPYLLMLAGVFFLLTAVYLRARRHF